MDSPNSYAGSGWTCNRCGSHVGAIGAGCPTCTMMDNTARSARAVEDMLYANQQSAQSPAYYVGTGEPVNNNRVLVKLVCLIFMVGLGVVGYAGPVQFGIFAWLFAAFFALLLVVF